MKVITLFFLICSIMLIISPLNTVALKIKNEPRLTVRELDDISTQGEWTIMIYLDGDNELERDAINDFLKMSEVGSTNQVNIVVQFDRRQGYSNKYDDWKTTKRYYLEKNMVPNNANALMDLGELNMGDPQTLIDFANWSITRYPADKYCLILWDHGNGWDGLCLDQSSGSRPEYDYLTLNELEIAFNTITSNGTNKLDLIGLDACIMQTLEVSYELRLFGNFMLASEALQWGGWMYNSTFSALVDDPKMSAKDLGEKFVKDYVSGFIPNYSVLSLINLSLIDDLITSINLLASKLRNKNHLDEMINVISNVSKFPYDSVYSSVDLYDLARLFFSYINDNDIKNAAQQVMNQVNNIVEYEEHGTEYNNTNGISIYVPMNDEYNSDYSEISFSKDTVWDELLLWYINYGNNPPSIPVTPSGPTNGKVGRSYTYSTYSNDSDGDKIHYDWSYFDSDGDIFHISTKYYKSGETCKISIRWKEKGCYNLTVCAIDEYGAQSITSSDPLSVTMPVKKGFIQKNIFNAFSLFLSLIKKSFV